MKRRSIIWLILCCLFTLTGPLSADYTIGEFKSSLETVTHVVDATIKQVSKNGNVELDINSHIKGEKSATLITGTSLSCTGQPPGLFGMEKGKRYIIMILNNKLYEEGTFFEIIERDDGTLGCNLSDFYKKWMSAPSSSVSLEDMKKIMTP